LLNVCAHTELFTKRTKTNANATGLKAYRRCSCLPDCVGDILAILSKKQRQCRGDQ
jgi:hypothetical protein